MSDGTDFRNLSRAWPSCGNQLLIDHGLNAFGLELFVESYWDAVARTLDHDPSVARESLTIEVEYRGMRVRLDPTPGLEAWDESRPTDQEVGA